MKNKNQLKLKFGYQEKSAINCPNCGEEMELIIQGKEKRGKCKKCGYIESNYND